MSSGLSWAPNRRVYLRSTALTALGTATALVVLGLGVSLYFALTPLWVFPTAALLAAGFVIDDAVRWRSHKYDRWEISDGHLIHEGEDGTATTPLSELDNAFARWGNRVIIELRSGQRMMLRYVAFPEQAAAQILSARPTPAA